MSSGAGHILDMMNRIRQNTALKISRRNKFKSNYRSTNTLTVKPEYDFPKISKSKLELIKSSIQKEALKERKKQRLTWIFLAVIGTVIFLIFNYIS